MTFEEQLRSILEAPVTGKDLGLELRAVVADFSKQPGEPELMRRLALARSFDRKLFEKLALGLQVRSFAEFVSQPGIDPLSKGSYAIEEQTRSELVKEWTPNSPELRAIAKILLKNAPAKTSSVEHMSAQILLDAGEGYKEFEALYESADRRFDLSECSLLIQILRTRNLLINDDLRLAWRRRQDYLNSRVLFSDDYYRTTAYLERQTLVDAFEKFWASPDIWLMQLYGKGGLGKTMFVRWLISRYAIPQKGIRVARLDFDALNRSRFAEWPWLVLLPIAAQLESQFEYASSTNPFSGFLGEMRGLQNVIRRAGKVDDKDLRRQLNEKGQVAPLWFQSALSDNPVLVVLDTCEEPLLHSLPAMRSMMALLEKLRFGTPPCSGLRLLVSGRYQMSAKGRLPEIAGEHAANLAPPFQIEPFQAQEAHDYLLGKRGMQAGSLVEAIVQKSRGNPFSLSLFADLAQSPEGLTVQAVRRMPAGDVVYLLDKVILRIPQERVRWLVRYAVVARTLTFDFVLHVLAPYMREEASGKTNRDPQNEFELPTLRIYKARQPWPETKIGDVKKIWNDLCRYASDPSWISVQQSGDAVTLQPEVVEPMRALLRTNPIYRDLQQSAEKYYRGVAESDAKNWSRHMADALFHLFQWKGRSAAKEWRKCIGSSKALSSVDRECFASVILGSSFLDDRKRPRKDERGRSIVDGETLARAYFETAYRALVQRIQLGRVDSSPVTGVLLENWGRFRRMAPSLQGNAAPSSLRNLLEAGVWIYRPKEGDKRTRLETARGYKLIRECLEVEKKPEFRLTAHLLAARALDYAPEGEAQPHLEKAADLAARIQSGDFPSHWVDFRFAAFYRRAGLLSDSRTRLVRALEQLIQEETVADHAPEVFWRLMAALRILGQYDEMAVWIAKLKPAIARPEWKDTQMVFQLGLADAQLAAERQSPLEALEILSRIEKLAIQHETAGAWAEASLEIASMLCDEQGVIRSSEKAAKEFRELGSFIGPIMATLLKAYFYVGKFSDFKNGAVNPPQVHSWEIDSTYNSLMLRFPDLPSKVDPNPELAPREMNLRIAADGFFFLLNAEQRAAAVVQGKLQLPAHPDGESYLARFFDALEKVGDAAKYRVLERLANTPGTLGKGDWLDRFTRIVPPPPTDSPDFPRVASAFADGLRVFGDKAGALRFLRLAEKRARPNVYQLLNLYQAIHRVETGARFPLEPYITQYLEKFENYPFLCATAALGAAQFSIAWQNLEDAWKYQAIAEAHFAKSPSVSLGHAQAKFLLCRLAETSNDEALSKRAYEEGLEIAKQLGLGEFFQKSNREVGRLIDDAPEASIPLVERAPTLTLRAASRANRFEWDFQSPNDSWVKAIFPGPLFEDVRSPYPKAALIWLQQIDPRHRELLFAESTSAIELPPGDALALVTEPDGLAALPWEWALGLTVFRKLSREPRLSETARYMQLALGLHDINANANDPALQSALRERPRQTTPHSFVRRSAGKTPPQVLLIRASERRRASSNFLAGIDASEVYRSQNVDSLLLRAEDLSQLTKVVPHGKPTVIHLECALAEGSEGVRCVLDGSGEVTAKSFTQHLRNLPTEYLRPLIAVDVPLPADSYNRTQQALLRNAFCAELLATECFRGVIGAGLCEDSSLRSYMNALAEGLAAQGTLRELHRKLWAVSGAYFPPSLWTFDPDLPA